MVGCINLKAAHVAVINVGMAISCNQDSAGLYDAGTLWLPCAGVFGEKSCSEMSTCVLHLSHDSSPTASSLNMNYSLFTVTHTHTHTTERGRMEGVAGYGRK